MSFVEYFPEITREGLATLDEQRWSASDERWRSANVARTYNGRPGKCQRQRRAKRTPP